jgi:hemerythrin superfamily protein
VFDPLNHPGIPVDRHGRHWREQDLEPVDARSADPYTRCRISTMQAVEAAAAAFAGRFVQRNADADARRSVDDLREAAARRRAHIAAVQPGTRSPLEHAVGYERAALDLIVWVARNEPEPDRASAYRGQARAHLDHLRSYAEFGERAGFAWADRVTHEVANLWPPSRYPRAIPEAAASSPDPAEQPMSRLHDWTVRATQQQVARQSGGTVPRPRATTGVTAWEELVVHESATSYLYYSFMENETDSHLRSLWELHLQMELAHLRAAGELLRRYAGREPQEVVGSGLAEPIRMEDTGRYLWVETVDEPEPGRGPVSSTRRRRGRPGRGQDLVELLTDQHTRMDGMFHSIMQTRGDRAHTTFAALAELITAHEVVEEELVHPLTRRVNPDDHVADRLLEEERQISEALTDTIRADRAGRLAEMIGALRHLVRTHDRHEERYELPRLRDAVPAQELRQMARTVRQAEGAAMSQGSSDDAAAAVTEAGDRVRDALRTVA